jgi:hypothetical protein
MRGTDRLALSGLHHTPACKERYHGIIRVDVRSEKHKGQEESSLRYVYFRVREPCGTGRPWDDECRKNILYMYADCSLSYLIRAEDSGPSRGGCR